MHLERMLLIQTSDCDAPDNGSIMDRPRLAGLTKGIPFWQEEEGSARVKRAPPCLAWIPTAPPGSARIHCARCPSPIPPQSHCDFVISRQRGAGSKSQKHTAPADQRPAMVVSAGVLGAFPRVKHCPYSPRGAGEGGILPSAAGTSPERCLDAADRNLTVTGPLNKQNAPLN
jgi:hypothetical protein